MNPLSNFPDSFARRRSQAVQKLPVHPKGPRRRVWNDTYRFWNFSTAQTLPGKVWVIDSNDMSWKERKVGSYWEPSGVARGWQMGQCPTFDLRCPTFDVEPHNDILSTVILHLIWGPRHPKERPNWIKNCKNWVVNPLDPARRFTQLARP